MTTLALLALLAVQDDCAKWIGQLGADSIVERDEATNRLRALGPAVLERLEFARGKVQAPEVRARLDAVIAGIRKGAELAKVFGPANRVTIAARKETLKEILAQLWAPGIATVGSGPFDEEARLNFQIRDATWWETLDRLARAAGGRCEVEDNRDGKHRVVLARGKEPAGPVLYAEQFRISVVEVKRFEFRSPASAGEALAAVVEVRHQPDLKPARRSFDKAVRIDSVRDAHGKDALGKAPDWIGSFRESPRALAHQAAVWLRPDAALPLTISGATDIQFRHEAREVSLDLTGKGRMSSLAGFDFFIEEFASSADGALLKIGVDSKDPADFYSRFESAVLIDTKGRRYEGTLKAVAGGEKSCTLKLEFTSGIQEPRRVAFGWVTEFYQVEIPFRLEGVRPPELIR